MKYIILWISLLILSACWWSNDHKDNTIIEQNTQKQTVISIPQPAIYQDVNIQNNWLSDMVSDNQNTGSNEPYMEIENPIPEILWINMLSKEELSFDRMLITWDGRFSQIDTIRVEFSNKDAWIVNKKYTVRKTWNTYTRFNYFASISWGYLDYGINIYKVTVILKDGSKKNLSFTIYKPKD